MGEVIAVLGGGQLGRMLGLAGLPMGLGFRFLDPVSEAPAGALGPLVVGDLGDEAALARVIEGAGVATYEWEGVPADGARFVGSRGIEVLPPPGALDVAQDRLAEKTMFRRLGIATAEFAAVDDRAGLDDAVALVGLPAVLKTRRGGYDGKGQRLLTADADIVAEAWDELGGQPLILEQLVPFDREVSVLAVRGRDGKTACWPVVENEHRDGILRTSRAPAPAADAVQATAEEYARRVLDELEYVGVLAIELFQTGDDLLANELAPRVHNSGHWTIEGAVTSQFENHVRAILGWPLGSTDPVGVSAMVNCIGALPDPAAVLAVPGAHVHDYGKAPRPGRKVGHVTVTANNERDLAERLAELPEFP